jgi:hypothetical protein
MSRYYDYLISTGTPLDKDFYIKKSMSIKTPLKDRYYSPGEIENNLKTLEKSLKIEESRKNLESVYQISKKLKDWRELQNDEN